MFEVSGEKVMNLDSRERADDFQDGQIGNNWDRSNLHNVDLKTALVEPPQRMTFLSASDETAVEAWVVLHKDP